MVHFLACSPITATPRTNMTEAAVYVMTLGNLISTLGVASAAPGEVEVCERNAIGSETLLDRESLLVSWC